MTSHAPSLLSLLSLFLLIVSASAKQPNVIVVMTDDMGYGDFGIKGNPHIKTPHIDAMAKRSFEMERFTSALFALLPVPAL